MVMKHYPAEFKADAVALYRSRPGATFAEVAQELGVHRETLRTWIRTDDAQRAPTVTTAHTGDLAPATLEAARALLYGVFDDMTEYDWEHSLGGMHALVWEGGELLAHASVVQRRLLHRGRALRAGYVEGVGVRADRRGRGHGAAMMAALERVIRGAYEVGALATTEEARGFYAARGWRRWRGPTFALTPGGPVRTVDADDCLYVLPHTAPLDPAGAITCDWRDGDVW